MNHLGPKVCQVVLFVGDVFFFLGEEEGNGRDIADVTNGKFSDRRNCRHMFFLQKGGDPILQHPTVALFSGTSFFKATF